MESRRQLQVGSLIQRFLGDIFQKKGHDWFGSTFVTISSVNMTPDLRMARIYISIMDEAVREKMMQKIESYQYAIKKELAKAIRNKVRSIPDLSFFLDDTLDEVMKLEKIFEDIKNQPKSENTNNLSDEYKD